MARKKKIKEKLISKQIPKLGLNLAKYSGSQMIERVGEDIIKMLSYQFCVEAMYVH